MSRRNIILLSVLGLVVVTAAWWLLLIGPQRSKIDDLRTEKENAELEEQSLLAQKAQLLEIQDNELTLMTATASLERLVPPSPELATFIDDVNLLADDTGVNLIALSPELPTQDPFAEFSQVNTLMTVEGQFFEMLGFLYGLSDMERLVRVDGVSLAPEVLDDGTVNLTASLDAVIFTTATIVPAAPAVDTETPVEEGTEETTDTTEAGDGG